MAARTAKQRAALRKAQLASARKRKGKGKLKPGRAGTRVRLKAGAKAGLIVGGLVAGYYGSMAYANYHSRKNFKAPKTDWASINRKISADHHASKQAKALRDVRNRTKVHHMTTSKQAADQANAARRRHRNNKLSQKQASRQARLNRKLTDRGLYNAGLSSNLGGRTFVAGRGGTYRR